MVEERSGHRAALFSFERKCSACESDSFLIHSGVIFSEREMHTKHL